MLRFLPLLIGYAFGCLQSAYLVGRLVKKIDVREHGSGNAGFTNAIRVMGTKIGFAVFVCDVLKAIAAFLTCVLIFSGANGFLVGAGDARLMPGLYAGLGVVLGHCFPFFLKFRGGKGVASSLGFMLVLDWRAALLTYAVGFALVAASRYISLASLAMALLFPIMLIAFGHHPEAVGVATGIAGLTFFLHRGNIQRLLTHTERKISFAKKPNLI